MEKTVVLFGAGAEVYYGLADGGEFASAVLGLNNDGMTDAIIDFCKEVRDEWYPSTIQNRKWSYDDLFIAAKMKEQLDSYVTIKSKKQFEESAAAESSEENEEKLIYISKHPSYMGLLDEGFHTLIFPRVLGPQRFWSVVECYWRAYLSLVSGFIGDTDYSKLMKYPRETFERIVEKAKEQKNIDSYYKIIAGLKGEKPQIITTNYMPLCSSICEIEDKSIAYLHGSFKWFEMPKELSVVDVSDGQTNPTNLYFPFIFLQSGVKPIVHPIQLKEYDKAMKFLEASSRLIVVGYKANHDDNHLNSILRDYLVQGKRIQYIDFDNVGEDIIFKRLHIFENKENYKIQIISIEESDKKDVNALKVFEDLLKE